VTRTVAEGPHFDDLTQGQAFTGAPAVTLTSGLAAQHQAIVGDRAALSLDHELAHRVTGRPGLAPPALVWDVAIGQTTLATHHVKANLFYRGLAFHRLPHLGDTLHTVTRVAGLRENQRKDGRAPTGLAALHIRTTDQEGRTVLDFHRCAMLPLRDPRPTGHADHLEGLGIDAAHPTAGDLLGSWDTSVLAARMSGDLPAAGDIVEVVGGDVVSSAPELARLTLNVARVHHDAHAGGGRRLVYGGHTIGIALAQVCRALPAVVTVLRWEGCDHVGPVHEGDTLRSEVEVVATRPLIGHAGLAEVDLRSRVTADGGGPEEARPVLDWRFTALLSAAA
jgi:acyl dehydratase